MEGTKQDSEAADKPKVVRDRGDYQRYDDQLKSWKDLISSVGDLWKGLERSKSSWPAKAERIRDNWPNPDLTYEQHEKAMVARESDRCYKRLAEIYDRLSEYSLNDYKQKMILKLVPISEIAKNDLTGLKIYDEVRLKFL